MCVESFTQPGWEINEILKMLVWEILYHHQLVLFWQMIFPECKKVDGTGKLPNTRRISLKMTRALSIAEKKMNTEASLNYLRSLFSKKKQRTIRKIQDFLPHTERTNDTVPRLKHRHPDQPGRRYSYLSELLALHNWEEKYWQKKVNTKKS